MGEGDRPAAGGHDPDADGVERGDREDASDENGARAGKWVSWLARV